MIPKVINYCWFGGNDLTPSAKKCINSWKKFCPDYKIVEWNETNYDYKKNKYMKEAYESKKWGFVSDYARLDIIYNYGGIYLDTDVEVIKPFDILLNNKGFAGMEEPGIVALGLGFGAEKNLNIIKELMNDYNYRKFIKDNGDFDTTPCPLIQTNTLKSFGLTDDNTIQNIGDLVIYSVDYFSPKSFQTGKINITENTFSIHHYDASWHDNYNNYCKELRWKFSKFLPNKLAKLFSIILAKIKYSKIIQHIIKEKI